MQTWEWLDTLCAPLGPPGREDAVRQLISELVTPWASRVTTDALGNLQVWVGDPERRPLVMLDSHMDEVSLVVQRILEGGRLAVAPLGGLEAGVLPGSRVILQPRPGREITGVVGVLPPHVQKAGDRGQAPEWDRLFVDTGLFDAEACRQAGLEPGTPGVLDCGRGRLGEKGYHARNLDDRAGCAVLCMLLEELAAGAELPFGLVLNFSVAEEVGLRGAQTAAFGLAPDLALVVEATVGDTYGVSEGQNPTRLGQGPAITVCDGRIVVPWRLVESLESAARAAGVAHQRKLPPSGGTNAGAIHTARAGVPTAVVSVPTRYIHSPASLLHLDDLDAVKRLVRAWLAEVPQILSL